MRGTNDRTYSNHEHYDRAQQQAGEVVSRMEFEKLPHGVSYKQRNDRPRGKPESRLRDGLPEDGKKYRTPLSSQSNTNADFASAQGNRAHQQSIETKGRQQKGEDRKDRRDAD